ncbi:hypothetical protein GCM10017711_37890 [Paeniglutamicibacter sulfureus]
MINGSTGRTIPIPADLPPDFRILKWLVVANAIPANTLANNALAAALPISAVPTCAPPCVPP